MVEEGPREGRVNPVRSKLHQSPVKHKAGASNGVKVAVASKDGRIINQHFGHAERFLIYKVDGDQINFVEERKVEKYCSGDEDHLYPVRSPCIKKLLPSIRRVTLTEEASNGVYDRNRFEMFFDAIKDCSILLVSRIGTRPEREFEKRGIKVFMVYDRIEEGIKTVLSGEL